ncbi:MAG: EutN/CcmL family microcompartment protein [Candidatus Hodarchaeales archaeon]|jgi:ethanolamine utilization protein EutN
MKLGKVIGNVVATTKDPGLDSLRLLVVQGLDDNLQPLGNPYVAADGIETAGPGDIVYVVSKKEAAIVFPKELVPIDECIVGYIEEYYVTKSAKRKPQQRKKKKAPPPTIKPLDQFSKKKEIDTEIDITLKPIPKSKISPTEVDEISKPIPKSKPRKRATRKKKTKKIKEIEPKLTESESE